MKTTKSRKTLQYGICLKVALAGVLVLLAVGQAQAAGYNMFFPYVNANDFPKLVAFGDPNNPLLKKIDAPSVDNVVWNTGRIWDDAPNKNGYFDQMETQMTWHMYIHNAGDDDFTTGSKHVRLYFYDAATGDSLDSNTKWKTSTGNSTEDLLITDNLDLPSGVTWVDTSTEDYYRVNVPAHSTKVISVNDVWDINHWGDLLALSPGQSSTRFGATLRLRVQGSGGKINAWISGDQKHLTRPDDSENLSSHDLRWGYEGIIRSGIAADSDEMTRLDYLFFNERYTDSPNHVSHDTAVTLFLVNGELTTQDFLIKVFKLDGSLHKEVIVEDLEYMQRFAFMPSQFLDSDNNFNQGYVQVFGKIPALVGFNLRFIPNGLLYEDEEARSSSNLNFVPVARQVACPPAGCSTCDIDCFEAAE